MNSFHVSFVGKDGYGIATGLSIEFNADLTPDELINDVAGQIISEIERYVANECYPEPNVMVSFAMWDITEMEIADVLHVKIPACLIPNPPFREKVGGLNAKYITYMVGFMSCEIKNIVSDCILSLEYHQKMIDAED